MYYRLYGVRKKFPQRECSKVPITCVYFQCFAVSWCLGYLQSRKDKTQTLFLFSIRLIVSRFKRVPLDTLLPMRVSRLFNSCTALSNVQGKSYDMCDLTDSSLVVEVNHANGSGLPLFQTELTTHAGSVSEEDRKAPINMSTVKRSSWGVLTTGNPGLACYTAISSTTEQFCFKGRGGGS